MRREDARLENSQPSDNISVVIPAASAPDVFRECLQSVCFNSVRPSEVLIIDDAMDDKARDICRAFNVSVLKNPGKGVSAARNYGASRATGDIILFMDTDVIVPEHALATIKSLMKISDVQGLVGVQSLNVRYRNFYSRYKNQWMRFTYRRLRNDIHLFYTSFAVIRRQVFLAIGGFDENYRMPSIEDTAFGAVLGREGIRIRPTPEIEVEHVKHYSLRSVLKTDFKRSSALVRYVMRNWLEQKSGGVRKTSVPRRFMLSAAIMAAAWISLLSISVTHGIGVGLFFACSGLILPVNSNWLRHLWLEEGYVFAVKSCLFLPLDVTFVITGMLWGGIGFVLGSRY